jgi:hypothetical protein
MIAAFSVMTHFQLFLPWNMAEIKIYRLDKKLSFIHNATNLSKVKQDKRKFRIIDKERVPVGYADSGCLPPLRG